MLRGTKVGIGTASPETPVHIVAANTLGSTFTGTVDGEGLRVAQSNYSADNYVSLVEAPYDDGQTAAHVRIGAMFDGGGSHLAFGTSNNYANGITNTAMFIDQVGNVGIGTTAPTAPLHLFAAADNADQIKISSTGGTVAEYGFLAANASTNAMRYGYWTGSGYGNHHFEGNVGVNTTTPYETFDMAQTSNLGVGTEITYGTHSNATFQGYINYHGYQGSNAQYRQLGIYDGKQGLICQFGYGGNPYVGMGVAAPGAPLDVRNSSYTGDTLILANTGDSGSAINECGIAFRHWPNGSHPSARIVVRENGNASWDSHMDFKTKATGTDAAPPTVFTIGAGGFLTSPATYSNTYAASANVYVHTTGGLYKATSSRKYKTDIEDIADAYADAVLTLRPVWYRSTCRDDRDDWSHWGLIAEEVAEIDERLVQYGYEYVLDENGTIVHDTFPMVDVDGNPVYEQIEQVDDAGMITYVDGDTQLMDTGDPLLVLDDNGDPVSAPENVAYTSIVPLLINLIKRQDARIAALEAA